ncbi:MAG: 50S ribosomal protein L19e [Candidatus Micrarchaeaceae archaeon]
MTIKFAKRAAAEMLSRGESAIRIKTNALPDAEKALTRDDIRNLIKQGNIYALPKKHNLSLHGKLLRKKRAKGRKRGYGKRSGTAKARSGMSWERKVRSQRKLLRQLRILHKLDTKAFRRFYLLVKGNSFPDKRSLLLHLSDEGIKVSDDELKQIEENIKQEYKKNVKNKT